MLLNNFPPRFPDPNDEIKARARWQYELDRAAFPLMSSAEELLNPKSPPLKKFNIRDYMSEEQKKESDRKSAEIWARIEEAKKAKKAEIESKAKRANEFFGSYLSASYVLPQTECSSSSEESSDSEESDSSKKNKKSDCSCYITSACLDDLNIPRSSLEMRAMKVLTKEYVLKSFRGKREYLQYGKRAPIIVEAIRSNPDSARIWKKVYENLKDIANSVFSGRYEDGHRQYRSLVLGLESEFVR